MNTNTISAAVMIATATFAFSTTADWYGESVGSVNEVPATVVDGGSVVVVVSSTVVVVVSSGVEARTLPLGNAIQTRSTNHAQPRVRARVILLDSAIAITARSVHGDHDRLLGVRCGGGSATFCEALGVRLSDGSSTRLLTTFPTEKYRQYHTGHDRPAERLFDDIAH